MTDLRSSETIVAGSKPKRRQAGMVKPPFAALAAEALPPVDAVPTFAEAIATAAHSSVMPVPAILSAAVVEAAVPTPSIIIDQGTDMATNAAEATQQTTDKVQTLISDAQTRARETMEKGTKAYDEMGSFAKGNVEALMTSSRVAASGLETLGQDMVEFGKRSMEQATTAFKSFAAVKSPTELFQLQSDFARTAFDGLVAESSKLSEKMLKLAGDMAQPLSNRAAMAAEKIKVGY